MNDNDRALLEALADRPVTAGLVRAVIRERDEARAALERLRSDAEVRLAAMNAAHRALGEDGEQCDDSDGSTLCYDVASAVIVSAVAALGGSPEETADSPEPAKRCEHGKTEAHTIPVHLAGFGCPGPVQATMDGEQR